MTRIILSGCNGKMGHTVRNIIDETEGIEIVAGIDISEGDAKFPVFTNIGECNADADAIIDFSAPAALDGILKLAVENSIPAVLCATGYNESQLGQIEEASKKVAILRSANMSLGINILAKLVAEAAQILADRGYDIEIVERHHNQKVDAPSGTALLLADAVNDVLDPKYEYVYDRSQRREKRPKKEIGISAVRGGSIVGDHEVIFAGLDEVIELKHSAYSKAVFAKGAVNAALFLANKPAGMYSMKDVIG
ncbi:MAG: 4-hydroxy-tetrahydrodipicolinate reductase [Lachnospiraceae bacterium]|nr:4-hydroxy-tetrahydrodipicolinate reductase [Lachnospiraceae bacterium]